LTYKSDYNNSEKDASFNLEDEGVETKRHNKRLEHIKQSYCDGDISRKTFEKLISDEIENTEYNRTKEKDKI